MRKPENTSKTSGLTTLKSKHQLNGILALAAARVSPQAEGSAPRRRSSEQLFELLKEVVDARFNAVPEYLDLTAELKGMNAASAVSELEAAIDRFKLGNGPQTVKVFGQEFDVAMAVQAMLGIKPEKYVLLTGADVQAKIDAGLMELLQYRASDGARGIPEEIKPFYKPVVWLGRIVTLFDLALRNMLAIYAQENHELHGLLHAMLPGRNPTLNYGLLIRALFPDGHKPILTLYPDERVMVKGEEGIAEKVAKLVKDVRAEIPGAVSRQLGMPEEQIRLEELVELQAQIMHVLPMPLYVCSDMGGRMKSGIQETKRARSQRNRPLTQLDLMLLTRYEAMEKHLQRDFATDPLSAVAVTSEVVDDAIKFFGEEFNFVRRVSGINEEQVAIRHKLIRPARQHAPHFH